MKRTTCTALAVALGLALSPSLQAQKSVLGHWTRKNGDVYNTNPGHVGIGTNSPESQLHVKGRLQLEGDLRLDSPFDSIYFSSTTGSNRPMMYLFSESAANSDRMIFSHSPAYEDWGLRYSDANDVFTFLRGGVSVLDIGHGVTAHNRFNALGGMKVDDGPTGFGLDMTDVQGGLVFGGASSFTKPIIQMFDGGSANGDRMLFAHSQNHPNWGLEYRDSGDEFAFLSGGTPVMKVDLGSKRVAIGSDATSGAALLQVGNSGDGSFAVSNGWNLFSSRDYKKDIEPLSDADCRELRDEVVSTPVFRFRYKGESEDTRQRLGLIVEESPEEVLAEEVKAVDVGRYVSLLHAAVKAQHAEIEAQRAQLEELKSLVQSTVEATR